MGGAQSIIDSPVFEPLHEVLNRLHHPLSIERLCSLPIPSFAKAINLLDIAILFEIDADKDGVFSSADIISFSEFVNREARNYPEHRLVDQVHGKSFLKLVRTLQEPRGVQCMCNILFESDFIVDVAAWMVKLITADPSGSPAKPMLTMSRDSLFILFRILLPLSPRPDTTFHSFFNSLNGLGSDSDDTLPVPIVRDKLLVPFFEHYCSLMTSIGIGIP